MNNKSFYVGSRECNAPPTGRDPFFAWGCFRNFESGPEGVPRRVEDAHERAAGKTRERIGLGIDHRGLRCRQRKPGVRIFHRSARVLRRVSLRGRNEKALFRIAPCVLRSTPRANVIPKLSATGKQSLRRFRQ